MMLKFLVNIVLVTEQKYAQIAQIQNSKYNSLRCAFAKKIADDPLPEIEGECPELCLILCPKKCSDNIL
jgi:hypothetical protein